jgi:hypothetical protein
MRSIHLQEPDMPRGDKSAHTDKQRRPAGTIGTGLEQKGVSRPATEARAWPTVNKLQGPGKKFDARRKVPSGPVGGSGRKTNLARSS